MTKNVRSWVNTQVPREMDALGRFSTDFVTGDGVLAILLPFALCWVGASLLTMLGGANALWDKRSAVTSALLSALVLAPLTVDLILVPQRLWSTMDFLPDYAPLRPALLLVPLVVALVALAGGLILMLRRAPRERENRQMPVFSLLIAYLAALGGLMYLAWGLDGFAGSTGFFSWLNKSATWLMILGPVAVIVLYGLLRGAQFRFGRVRNSAPVAFAATLRYGSAIAVGLFATVYMVTLILTAHYGVKADAMARKMIVGEASFVRSAFR
jgi:hypothetical protein